MAWVIRLLMPMAVLRPVARPATRFLVGFLSIPLFRIFLRRVVRLQELDAELEKDLEQWFRASMILLVATANMEQLLFPWVPLDLSGDQAWIGVAFRILLAISVVESMPDQRLFTLIHPGPPRLNLQRGKPWFGLRGYPGPYVRGLFCQHLAQSSPVFAIMAAIFGGDPSNPEEYTHWLVGWCCYGLAVFQYLIIGLVTSKDKALDALSAFDQNVAERREELMDELRDRNILPESTASTNNASSESAAK